MPPSPISAVAQDHEGYLWLGTASGPVRFDGVRFVLWQPTDSPRLPKAPVRTLCVARDGSLWVGFGGRGFVSRIINGVVRNYGEADGLVSGAITALDEAATATFGRALAARCFASPMIDGNPPARGYRMPYRSVRMSTCQAPISLRRPPGSFAEGRTTHSFLTSRKRHPFAIFRPTDRVVCGSPMRWLVSERSANRTAIRR